MDGQALRDRLEVLHPESFGWALACCDRDPEAAREVLQMTYLKVLDGRARWGETAAFRTWLFAVIRNTAAEHRRRAWLTGERLTRWWRGRPDAGLPRDPEAAAAAAESARLVRDALAGLPRRQREVLHLVFYSDLTVDAAAEVLGIAPGSARIHYERGKARLRERLPRGARP